MTLRLPTRLACATALLLAAAPASAAAPAFTVTFLGSFGGDTTGVAINNGGAVVGAAKLFNDGGTNIAFVSDGLTTTRLLSTPPGAVSIGHDINDNGVMIGALGIGPSTSAILYDTRTDSVLGSAPVSLGPLGTLKLNNSNQVTGTMLINHKNQAVFYDGAAMHGLGTLGGDSSTGTGINNLGHVVGTAYTAAGDLHGFRYDGTAMHDLGSFLPTGINDSGQIVGREKAADGHVHAFLYDSAGPHDLGTLVAGQSSWGEAINAAGHVVGKAQLPDSSLHAVYYDGTAMYDLAALVDPADPYAGTPFGEAVAINDYDQIVVNGCYPSVGACYSFRLSPKRVVPPVPPPGNLYSDGAGQTMIAPSGAVFESVLRTLPPITITGDSIVIDSSGIIVDGERIQVPAGVVLPSTGSISLFNAAALPTLVAPTPRAVTVRAGGRIVAAGSLVPFSITTGSVSPYRSPVIYVTGASSSNSPAPITVTP